MTPKSSRRHEGAREHLARGSAEIELEQIEQKWAKKQKRYYVDYSSEGDPVTPETPHAVGTISFTLGGFCSITFGILVPKVPLWVCIMFISFGLIIPIPYIVKYSMYKRAFRIYQRERGIVLMKLESRDRRRLLITALTPQLEIETLQGRDGESALEAKCRRLVDTYLAYTETTESEREHLVHELLNKSLRRQS